MVRDGLAKKAPARLGACCPLMRYGAWDGGVRAGGHTASSILGEGKCAPSCSIWCNSSALLTWRTEHSRRGHSRGVLQPPLLDSGGLCQKLTGVERRGVEWSGGEWSGLERRGMECSGGEWRGVERRGVERRGVEWSGA